MKRYLFLLFILVFSIIVSFIEVLIPLEPIPKKVTKEELLIIEELIYKKHKESPLKDHLHIRFLEHDYWYKRYIGVDYHATNLTNNKIPRWSRLTYERRGVEIYDREQKRLMIKEEFMSLPDLRNFYISHVDKQFQSWEYKKNLLRHSYLLGLLVCILYLISRKSYSLLNNNEEDPKENS